MIKRKRRRKKRKRMRKRKRLKKWIGSRTRRGEEK